MHGLINWAGVLWHKQSETRLMNLINYASSWFYLAKHIISAGATGGAPTD